MGYHAINEGSNIPVYWASDCPSDGKIGTLYNGEVFTLVREHMGYFGHYEIRFLKNNGSYELGFINSGQYGNLAYSGQSVTESALGSACYRFKLRKNMNVVSSSGSHHTTLSTGDYVYTRGATCGESNPANMHIIGYKKGSAGVTSYTGFLTLNYAGGSMFSKNFCLYKA
ncbi:MAG: hypothetical protein QM657_07700 [Lacrimispora sp.]|uniref:hypothetical protein n=1 Tax=Lacrimispora sp. TaxID=2719234 RepID=UPI0039E3041D